MAKTETQDKEEYEEIFRGKDLSCNNCDLSLDEDSLNKIYFADKYIYLCDNCKYNLYNQEMKGGDEDGN